MSIEPEWGSTLVFPNSPSSPAPFLQSPVQSSSLSLDTGETSENREESDIPLEDSSSEDSERGRSRSDSGARSAQIAGLAIASALRIHQTHPSGVASTPPPTPLARIPSDVESPLRDDFASDPLSDMTSPKSYPISSPAPTPPTTPQNRVGTGGSIDYGHRPTFYKAVTLEPKRGPSPMHKKGSSSFKTQSTAHSVGIPPTPPVTPASSQLRASAIAAAHSGTGPTPPPTPLAIDSHREDPKSPSGSFLSGCHVTECRGHAFLRGYCTKHWRLARRNTEDEEALGDYDHDDDVAGDMKIASIRSPKQGIGMPWLVYSEEGESHWKEWKDPLQSGEKDSPTLMSQSLTSKSVAFEKYTNPKTSFELSPSSQLICVLTGVLGIQASTGPMRTFAPGECVLLEDVKGKGHRKVLVGGGSHTVLRTLLTRETTSCPLPFLPIVSEEETDVTPAEQTEQTDEYPGIEIDTTSSLDTTAVHR